MATYSVQRAKHATLVATTVDTVDMSMIGNAIRILNRDGSGGDTFYFTIDGTTPTVAGDDTYVLTAGQSIDIYDGNVASVKLISSGTPDYSVEKY